MTSKRAKRVMDVTTSLKENKPLPFQSQAAKSKYRSKSSTTNRISMQVVVDLTTEAEEGDNQNQETGSNDHVQNMDKRRSSVWAHMKKQANDKASCNRCGKVLCRKNSGTTGLRKHLHQIHKLNQFASSSVTKRSRTAKFLSRTKKTLDALVVRCVVEDGRSFGDLRRPGLLKIFNELAPGYTPPHGQTIQQQLVRLYSEHKRLLTKRLSTVPWIAITCDFWLDKRLHSYLCITGHCITSDFKSYSKVIAFSSFEQQHYSVNIAYAIEEKLTELNVLEKTTTITTDGAAIMVKTSEALPSRIKRFPCFAHRLHLTVCNSLGLWIREQKQATSSSIITAASMTIKADPDDSDEDDYTDDGRLSPTVSSHESAVQLSKDSQRFLDDDEQQLLTDDSYINAVDNWSEDVVVDFDPSTCAAEQASIGILMTKCRSFVKLVSKSLILKGYVNKRRKQFNVKQSLQMDCDSRWSSSHHLLQTMVTYKKLINRLYSEKHDIGLNDKQVNKLISIELNEEDWAMVEAIECVLHPFAKAAKLVSGQRYPTVGITFFAVTRIREYLEDEECSDSNDFNILSRLKQLLMSNMKKYFEKDLDQWNLLKKHAYFDPIGFGVLQRADRRAIERELCELYEKMSGETAENTENEMDQSLSLNTNFMHIPPEPKRSSMLEFLDSLETRRSNPRNYFEEELCAYRSLAQKRYHEIVAGVNGHGDVMDFWRLHHPQLKRLSTMAVRFLATPASSVPSESAFSTASYSLRKQRSHLHPPNSSYSIFLKDKMDDS